MSSSAELLNHDRVRSVTEPISWAVASAVVVHLCTEDRVEPSRVGLARNVLDVACTPAGPGYYRQSESFSRHGSSLDRPILAHIYCCIPMS
jgi:hypothetical protein